MPLRKANRSRCKYPMRLRRYRLTVFKAVSDHAKCQYLGFVPRLLLGGRINEDARKRRHFADPSPILLAFNLDPHVATPNGSAHLVVRANLRQRLADRAPPR